MLALVYLSANAYDDAVGTMKKELDFFPEDSYTRSLMKKLQDAQAQGPPPAQNPQ
jgi:hypothetical protein